MARFFRLGGWMGQCANLGKGMDSEEPEEIHYPSPGVDCEAIAKEVKEHVLASFVSPRRIDIWAEGGFFDTWHKQIGFSVWYTTYDEREAAIADGEAKRLEELLRSECLERGFPESQIDRIYVWIDCHQAMARGLGKEEVFNEWLEGEEQRGASGGKPD